jgi:hypothetical protein
MARSKLLKLRMLLWLVPVMAASALVTAYAAAPADMVTISTQIDFTEEPFQGTFKVTDGAAVLGCASGTFVDTPPATPTGRGIYKEFTCESGSRTGTFTAEFWSNSGPWKIVDASDEFRGLAGWGAFVVVYTEFENQIATAGVETLIGEIHYSRSTSPSAGR